MANFPPADDSALPAGARLGFYRINGELGRGGFGITYQAHDARLDRLVVIKEFLPQDFAARRGDYTVGPRSGSVAEAFQSGLDSFLKEAQTLARFNHPNIVPVLDFFKAKNGTAYLVMPFLPGETLAANLARHPGGRLNETEIRAWLEPILEGLRAVHSRGFLHRDLKPENIYLQSDGNPVLIDFGSARQALGRHSRNLTLVLTPGYAPLEQYSGAAAAQGPWTDLYALGAVLYRCLTGAEPIDAIERQEAVINGEPDPLIQKLEILKQLAKLKRLAGPGLIAVVEGCLRLARKERLQGVMELRQALSGEATLEAILPSPLPPQPKERPQGARELRQALSGRSAPGTAWPSQPPVPTPASPDASSQGNEKPALIKSGAQPSLKEAPKTPLSMAPAAAQKQAAGPQKEPLTGCVALMGCSMFLTILVILGFLATLTFQDSPIEVLVWWFFLFFYLYTLFLYFKRKASFPTTFVLGWLGIYLLNCLFTIFVVATAPELATQEDIRDLMGGWVPVVVCWLYVHFSKKVKRTFVNR